MKYKSVCPVCGVTWEYSRKHMKACSRTCFDVLKRKRLEKTTPPTATIVCPTCGKSFPWWKGVRSKRPKYCSYACSNGAAKTKKGRNPSLGVSKLTMRPSSINRTKQCYQKIGPFSTVQCKHYSNWLTDETKFFCECGGFER